MRILILKRDVSGIVFLSNLEHYFIDNVKSFSKISDELYRSGKKMADFKYCEFGDTETVPNCIKIKDKMFNQMDVFEVERVKYSELNLDDSVKESMIKEMVCDNNKPVISTLEDQGVRLLFRKEIGEDKEEEILKIGAEIEKLEKEIKECNYKDYMDELV